MGSNPGRNPRRHAVCGPAAVKSAPLFPPRPPRAAAPLPPHLLDRRRLGLVAPHLHILPVPWLGFTHVCAADSQVYSSTSAPRPFTRVNALRTTSPTRAPPLTSRSQPPCCYHSCSLLHRLRIAPVPPPRTPAASPARLGHSARHCSLRAARLRPSLAPAALARVLHAACSRRPAHALRKPPTPASASSCCPLPRCAACRQLTGHATLHCPHTWPLPRPTGRAAPARLGRASVQRLRIRWRCPPAEPSRSDSC
jgi:hypothetical protein